MQPGSIYGWGPSNQKGPELPPAAGVSAKDRDHSGSGWAARLVVFPSSPLRRVRENSLEVAESSDSHTFWPLAVTRAEHATFRPRRKRIFMSPSYFLPCFLSTF